MTAGDALKQYKTHLAEIGETTSLASKAGSAFKGILGNVASFAINAGAIWAVSKALEVAINKWEEYSKAQENAVERGQKALSTMQENQNKIKSAQELLADIKSNSITLSDGSEITRFEQLSQGVNSLGQNVSLTKDEFAEYNSILEQLSGVGFTATDSMSNLEQQLIDLRRSANADTLKGLGDWIDSFNAQNNQTKSDFTKEIGWQQRIDALNKIYADPNAVGDTVEKVDAQKWYERLISHFKAGALFQSALGTFDSEMRDIYLNSAEATAKQSNEMASLTESIMDFAKQYDIDILDDNGNFDYEKYSSDKVQSQIEDALTNLKSTVESSVRESSGYLKALFENDKNYASISESATTAIKTIFDNIDYDTISTYMMDSNGMLSQSMMQDWVSGISKKITDSGVQDKLNKLFDLDLSKSKMTFSEYKKQANDLMTSISNSVPELSKSLLSKTTGIDDTINDLQTSYNRIQKIFGKSNADKLTNQELELAVNIIAKNNFSGTFDELLKQIHQAKTELDLDATPLYDEINKAFESGNRGDIYKDMVSKLKTAKELYDKGEIGTDDFKSVAKWLSPSGADDAMNFQENWGKAQRYFTEDSAKGVQNFLKDLESKGLAESAKAMDANGNAMETWTYKIEDLEEAAQKLGIGFEPMMSMFARLEDYGFSNNFVGSLEQGKQRISDKAKELAEAEAHLAELEREGIQKNGKYGNQTAIDAQRDKIAQLRQDIIETTDAMKQLAEHSAKDYEAQVEGAKSAISTLQEEREKVLNDKSMDKSTRESVAGMMEDQIRAWAQEYHIELDADLNVTNIDEIESQTVTLKGTVDLTERPKVSGETMNEAGWSEVEPDSTATVYSSAYSNESGDKTVLVTPILPDGEVLSPEALEGYANQLLNGEEIEPNITIRTFEGNDSIEQSNRYAQALHKVQDAYYSENDARKESLNKLRDYSAEQLKSIDLYDSTSSSVEDLVRQMMNSLGVGKDSLSEFVDVLNDMNLIGKFEIDYSNIDELKSKAVESKDTVQDLINQTKDPIKLNFDSDNVRNIDNQISAVSSVLKGLQDENGVIDITTEGAQEAINVLNALYAQKNQLTGEILMSIDTSQLDGDVAEVIGKLQEFHNAYTELQNLNTLNAAGVTVDTSDAEEKLSSITSEIQGLSGKQAEILATIIPDPSSQQSIESSIASITPKIMVEAGVDETAIEGYNPDDKDADVKYDVDDKLVQLYEPPDKNGKANYKAYSSDQLISWTPPKKTGTVEYTTSIIQSSSGTNNSTKIGKRADGTAHVNGTAPKIKSSSFNDGLLGDAHASGDWSLKQDETALTGELGREIVVRDGRFFTIGDNGAEFTKLKKGDIIFNHRQTEDLLSKGYVTGRGKLIGGSSHVDGTAYANGSGGGSFGVGGSGSKSGATTSSKKSTTNNTKAVNKNTSATNKNTKAIEDSQDWVSIRLDRISKQLDEYKTLASDYYQAFANQNKMLDSAINQVKANIQTNEQAYMVYMQKANSIGLDAGYKQRVMNGEINIETITDENLKNLISEFQDFYEKAQDCREAIIDLKSQIVELSTQKIDNILDDYDTFLAMSDSIYGRFEANNKLLDAQGKSASEYNLQMMLNQRNNQVMYSRGELEDLVNLNNSLLQSGDIKMWSQEWYDLQGKIHDVYTQIYEAETEVYELRQQLREVRWEPFRKAIEQIDAVNDNLENTLSLISDLEAFGKDSDALNMNGKLQLGLLTKQLGNARQAVAEYENAFKALDNELANGNITQEQYDEQLKELNEGRWEAVSSVKKYRDAILSLVKEGINKETEAMQKLVDARKKDLQAQKDAADYARTLRDKTTEINKIKAQIAALQGDDSATAKAQLRNLQNQLKEKEQDLQDTQDDHAFDVLQDGYDNAMEKFEEIQENELYLLNSSMEAQNEAIANMLMVARDNYQEIYDELNEIAEVYGMKLSDDIVNPWTTATEAVNAYKQAVGNLSSQTTIDTSPINGVSGNTDYVRYEENNNSAPDNNVTQQQQSTTTISGKISDVPEVLQYGSQGNSVKLLQTALNGLGYNCGAVDGSFGDQTLAAVKRFQKSVGMAGDGIVGDNTKAHFRARGYAKGSPNTQKGLAYYDEEGLGSEVIITDKGILRQFDAGEIVFNAEQAKYLYDTSKYAVKHNFPNAQMPLYNPELLQRDYGVHFDNLLNVEGNLTEEVYPKVKSMLETALKNFEIKQRRDISNNYRKAGGRLF